MRTGSALIAAIILGVVSFATPALAQSGTPRRIAHPHDPAPTLTEDITALQTMLGVTVVPGGGPTANVVGLDTLRLGQALRDGQRAAPSQPTVASVPPPPGGGGFTNFICACFRSELVLPSSNLAPPPPVIVGPTAPIVR